MNALDVASWLAVAYLYGMPVTLLVMLRLVAAQPEKFKGIPAWILTRNLAELAVTWPWTLCVLYWDPMWRAYRGRS